MLKALRHTKIKPDLNVNLKGNFNDIDYHTGTFNCISILIKLSVMDSLNTSIALHSIINKY